MVVYKQYYNHLFTKSVVDYNNDTPPLSISYDGGTAARFEMLMEAHSNLKCMQILKFQFSTTEIQSCSQAPAQLSVSCSQKTGPGSKAI